MSLRIFTLGSFRVRQAEMQLADAAWKTQKNKTLLQLLLTFRERPLVREQILEYLWPDLTPEAADRNLRVAISQLRNALAPTPSDKGGGSTFILTTDRGYAWNADAPAWLDVDEFERLCVSAEQSPTDTALAEQARELYRGDYLAEERYAEWATVERERLRELYFALLTRMAEAYARKGHYRRAISLTREVLAADRVRESVWCQLMLYHYHAGDPGLALRAYEECRTALAQELDAEPLAETIKLADQIRLRRVVERSVYPAPPELERLREMPVSLGHVDFVGRESEWALLSRYWQAARKGQPGIVLIKGEPGIGKTRLAEEFLAQAASQGVSYLEGKGRELGGALPYQALIDALRASPDAPRAAATLDSIWQLELAPLIPEWTPGDGLPSGTSNPGRLYEALARLFEELANSAGLVLLLDDAQWLDQATIQFLSYWGARRGSSRTLLLLTARTDQVEAGGPLATLLGELTRGGHLSNITLPPLSREAAIELVRRASHDSPDAARLAARVYGETQGYPLFFLSFLQMLFDDGLVFADTEGLWHGDPGMFAGSAPPFAVPDAVIDLLMRRVQRLEVGVQTCIQLAAVLGRPFELEWMLAARQESAEEVLAEIEQAVARRLLREDESTHGSAYETSHDLIRRAVYQALLPDRRTRLHRQVLNALEEWSGGTSNPAELAYHAQRGHYWSKTVSYSLASAQRALESYAMAEALQHCSHGLGALDALASSGERADKRQVLVWRHDLLSARQLAEHLLGQRDPGRLDALLDLAQKLNDRERLAKAYHARMRHSIDTGQNNAALELVNQYAAIVDEGVAAETAIGFHQRVGFLYYRVGDMERALFHHDQALQLAKATQEPESQAYVLNTRGTVLMCLGRFEQALHDFTCAADFWDVPARRIFRTFALDNRADVYYYLGHYETVLASKVEALAQYREFRYPIAEAECLAEMGNALRALGRRAEAEESLRQGLALSETIGDSYDLVQSLIGLSALFMEGESESDLVRAEEFAQRAVATAEQARLPHGVILGLAYRAAAVERQGDPVLALSYSTRAVAILRERKFMEGPAEEVYWIHSRVLASNGKDRAAQAALEQAAAELTAKADLLADPDLRRSLLEDVRVNRTILTALDGATAPYLNPPR